MLFLLLTTSLAVPVPDAAASLDGGHEVPKAKVDAQKVASAGNNPFTQDLVDALTQHSHSCDAAIITDAKGKVLVKAAPRDSEYDIPATQKQIADAVLHFTGSNALESIIDVDDGYDLHIVDKHGGSYEYLTGDDVYMWFADKEKHRALFYYHCLRPGEHSDAVLVGFHNNYDPKRFEDLKRDDCANALENLYDKLQAEGTCLQPTGYHPTGYKKRNDWGGRGPVGHLNAKHGQPHS